MFRWQSNPCPEAAWTEKIFFCFVHRKKSIRDEQWDNIRENASKAFQGDDEGSDDDSQLSADELRARKSAVGIKTQRPSTGFKYWRAQLKTLTDRLLYQYFNWRCSFDRL